MFGSCCYDFAQYFCEQSFADIELATNIEDCDILVVATKLSKLDLELISCRMKRDFPPKLIALGSCSVSGGVFNSINLPALDKLDIPIDLSLFGCPPDFKRFSTELMSLLEVTK